MADTILIVEKLLRDKDVDNVMRYNVILYILSNRMMLNCISSLSSLVIVFQ